MYTAIRKIIEAAWENRELLKKEETRSAIDQVIGLLDKGKLRTATPTDEGWQVNEWVKNSFSPFHFFKYIIYTRDYHQTHDGRSHQPTDHCDRHR